MKIEAIDIVAFGKFKDYHLELGDDMTVVFGENETGKSTLMSFIRMMFYGNTGKSSDIRKNPRKKYRPWSSEVMAGSITFTFEGNRYRLEREFKGSNSADKINLVDLDTGIVQTLSGSTDVGARFFGLTDGAFERSVFLEANSIPSPGGAAGGELNARLSNVAVTVDEDVSFEEVSNRLQKAREQLFSKRGKIGKSDKASAELTEVKDRLLAAEKKEAEIAELTQKANDCEERLTASSVEGARLFEQLKNTDKMKKRIFVERYLYATSEAEDKARGLTLVNGEIADQEYIRWARALYSAAKEAEKRLLSASSDTEILRAEVVGLEAVVKAAESDSSEDAVNELTEKQKDNDRKLEEARAETERLNLELGRLVPRKTVNLPFIIIGLIIAALGGAVALLQITEPLLPLVIAAVGLVLTLLGFIIKKTVLPDDGELKAALSDNAKHTSGLLDIKQKLSEQMETLRKSTHEHSLELAAKKALLENQIKKLGEKTEEAAEARREYDGQLASLLAHLELYRNTSTLNDAGDTIAELEKSFAEYTALTERLRPLAETAGCVSAEDAREKLAAMDAQGISSAVTEQEVDRIKESFKAHTEASGRLRSELAAVKAQIKALTETTESVAVLERKRRELTGKINEYERFANTADLALSVLDEAFRELRRSYSGVLEKKTADIFSQLTEGRYSSVNISKDFELNITSKDAFGLKESAYLSSGTEDQLYLALRLALSELITEDTESLPIFMDDPLADYDDGRAEKAVRFMKGYSQNKQLIMFTCHKGFADMAREQDIDIIDLQEV